MLSRTFPKSIAISLHLWYNNTHRRSPCPWDNRQKRMIDIDMEEKIVIHSKSRPSFMTVLLFALMGIVTGLVVFITSDEWVAALPVAGALTLLGLLLYLVVRTMEITVTHRRVYAHTGWKRDSSIPLSAISSVGKLPFGGLVVGSSSCKIRLYGLRDQQSIYDSLNELLMQTAPVDADTVALASTAPSHSDASGGSAPVSHAPTPASAPALGRPASASPVLTRISIPPESPNGLPEQIAMQVMVQGAVQSANAPAAPELPVPGSHRTSPTSSDSSPSASHRTASTPPTRNPAVANGTVQIGQCTACGKSNIPVTVETVTIAGRTRVRYLCEDCAVNR